MRARLGDIKRINKCINPTSLLTAEPLDAPLFAPAETLQLNDLALTAAASVGLVAFL